METRSLDAGTDIHRRLFTVDEYYRMAKAGILCEDDRVELLDGAIVEMSPIGTRHAAGVDRLTAVLHKSLQGRGTVRVQGPIRLNPRSEPLPDIAVLRPRDDFYASAHPTPSDVMLVVEVADTSLPYDRGFKLGIYARAGISEVWIVDVLNERVDVYTRPEPNGYQSHASAARGERLASTVAGTDLLVDDILPPRT
jgi:Uma2 family endonuclease